MVERERFKTLVKGMKAVYAQPSFIPDQDAFNVWYSLLRDLSYEELSAAIQKHMMTSPYPPTIADIRGSAAQLMPDDGGISELKAWGLVRKAIRNSNYHAEEEYARLPDIIQAAVGNPANLREWAMMPTETVESVEQSHFIKAYRAETIRAREAAKLAPEVRKLYVIEQDAGLHKLEGTSASKAGQPSRKDEIPMPDHARQKMQELVEGW